jgi:hypothetical protein
MIVRKVRIRGTINDEVEVEVEEGTPDEEVVEQALSAWRYVEYEDLEGEID